MSRVQSTDTVQSVMIKMCDGNPGALSVCCQLINNTQAIDPDYALGGLGYVLSLDALSIYGPRIWQLYKDVCGESLEATIGILRAEQLGFIEGADILLAIEESYGHKLDVAGLLQRVKERLPQFGKVMA